MGIQWQDQLVSTLLDQFLGKLDLIGFDKTLSDLPTFRQ